MTAQLQKHSTLILISVLLILLILARLFPSSGLVLGIIFLFLSLFIASSAALEEHKKAYRSGKISRAVFIRNAALESIGILLAMVAAGLLGRYVAALATGGIDHDLARLAAGILLGLVTGIAVGFSVQRAWGRLLKALPEG